MQLNSSLSVLAVAALLVAVTLSAAGCVTPGSQTMRDVLDAEIVTFAPGEVPDALVDTLSTRRVILLGETHYVQQHQEFVLELLTRLHPRGLRWFAQEMSHAYSWIVEDYVLGRRDDYPDSARRMDEYWVEGLRRFNDGVPESDQIGVAYIDMNHAHDALLLSLSWMVRGTEAGERIGPIVADVLAAPGRQFDAYVIFPEISVLDSIRRTW